MKKLSVFLISLGIVGCNNIKTQEADIPILAECGHSAQELSKIPFGPTSTEDYLIKLSDKEFNDAGYNYYMGAYAWGADGNGGLAGWVWPDGMTEGAHDLEPASPEKVAVMNRLKKEYEKLPMITYIYCNGESSEARITKDIGGRTPVRYNPEYPIRLRAVNSYQDEGMVFLYFEDENCNPVYKTPNTDRGNIILKEVCRPLNPNEKRPLWSVS